jgi:hypothetical protein
VHHAAIAAIGLVTFTFLRPGKVVEVSQFERIFPKSVSARFSLRLFNVTKRLLTLAWLRILDALTSADPETPADEKRERDREQIERAFPKNEP